MIGRLAVVADERGHSIARRCWPRRNVSSGRPVDMLPPLHSEDKNFAMYEHLGYRITSELFDNGTHGWLVRQH